ncbi:LacI family DNA-binding transcriptional regulator [Enterococcus sp. BWR-S5]|uniref:LacI family DNA-binding transcriptional regulator n=1 Tax=Enterococcus sp. BWR-S5 TaxID=2787714 RepID=UPI001921B319|nr:LacI family DNA-binding transcriptional regulator [Enterococcus sp. BWR-S5]MBL1225583.1 LacI family DNA-binding transcriptional regulator [Enterococcus sp. BWR-S5]
MSVTIKDVAREVGVAPSTVSRTLQDHPSISKATKEKVRKAMEKLGYVPNAAAQNLAKKYANTIGVVFPVLSSSDRKSNPFYLEAITAMNQEAGKQDVTISIASGETQEELLENVQLMYKQKRVDGFILLYIRKDDPVLNYLVEYNIPYTVIGQPYRYNNGTSSVDNDNQLLGRTAAQYLIDKGHERILFVTNYEKENVFQERFYGYEKSMEENELKPYPYVVLKKPEDYTAFEDVLKESQPTACIAIDDMFALRVIQLCNLYGYQVPDDISVISFNNSIFTSLIHPYITSIDIHTEELGKVAVQQFLIQLKDQQALKQKVLIPHTLIERETVLDRNKQK